MMFINILILIVLIALSSINRKIHVLTFPRIASIILIYTGVLSFNSLYIQSIGSGIGVYSGLFQVTYISQSFDIFISIIGALILIAWSLLVTSKYFSKKDIYTLIKTDAMSIQNYSREYSLIILMSALGLSLLVSSSDLTSLYLSIEENAQKVDQDNINKIENAYDFNFFNNNFVSSFTDNIVNNFLNEFLNYFKHILDPVHVDYSQSILADKNKLLDNNPIWGWIEEFNNYLSTLSLYELCFLINTLLSTFILSCLISILFSFYGNFLIDKFNLESKFPKLSGLIKLRVKFLHSSVLFNSLLIVIALIFLFYINIHTLLLPK